jgi:hypothetical protein
MTRKRQGKKGTTTAERSTLAGLASGRRGAASAEAAPAVRRGPGRPTKHAADDRPVRVGVYLAPDLMAWLFEETARRKVERRDASISELVAEAVAALRNKKGDR